MVLLHGAHWPGIHSAAQVDPNLQISCFSLSAEITELQTWAIMPSTLRLSFLGWHRNTKGLKLLFILAENPTGESEAKKKRTKTCCWEL